MVNLIGKRSKLTACEHVSILMANLEAVRVQTIFDPALLAALDAHRKYAEPDIPSRAETIRRLVAKALARQSTRRKSRSKIRR